MNEESSENIFKNFKNKNSRIDLLKAELCLKIHLIILEKKLTQVEVSKMTGFSQSTISKLLTRKLKQFSVDRLMNFVINLGYDVTMNFKKHEDLVGCKL